MVASEITQVYDQTMDQHFIDAVMERIKYKEGWTLDWITQDGLLLFEWKSTRPDSRTGEIGVGSGGPNFLRTYDLTEETLVRMIFAAALRFEEHECREFFMYDSQRPFDPHKELIVLLGADPCTCGRIVVGMTVTDSRNWHQNCPAHGVDSQWYEDLGRDHFEKTIARSVELQRQAREAREAAHAEG